MSRYGIISDIHGNLHAFQAVLCRLGDLQIDELVCLGDVVGYGPNPDSCLDLVFRHCSVLVQGNHDESVVDPVCARAFNGPARDAIMWTIDNLGPLHMDALNRMKSFAYVEPDIMCVHSSPVPGPHDYIHDQQMAAIAFRGIDRRICLLGHTHVPMVFETKATDMSTELKPVDITAYLPGDGLEHHLDSDHRYICNPGSVGQPRDCDPRASFAILDTGASTFTVYRQEYDVLSAQQATQQAGLPLILAERLAIGA